MKAPLPITPGAKLFQSREVGAGIEDLLSTWEMRKAIGSLSPPYRILAPALVMLTPHFPALGQSLCLQFQ